MAINPKGHTNPPRPPGTRLLQQVEATPDVTAWALELLNNSKDYPMFSETTRYFGAKQLMIRIEWHTWTHRAGKLVHGIYRGTTVYAIDNPDNYIAYTLGQPAPSSSSVGNESESLFAGPRRPRVRVQPRKRQQPKRPQPRPQPKKAPITRQAQKHQFAKKAGLLATVPAAAALAAASQAQPAQVQPRQAPQQDDSPEPQRQSQQEEPEDQREEQQEQQQEQQEDQQEEGREASNEESEAEGEIGCDCSNWPDRAMIHGERDRLYPFLDDSYDNDLVTAEMNYSPDTFSDDLSEKDILAENPPKIGCDQQRGKFGVRG